MSRELPFIKIPAKRGEKVRKLLQEVQLLAKDYKIMAEGMTLLIPLQPDTRIEKIREHWPRRLRGS
jgi:tRNA G37 N-methylase Trm5